MTERKVNRLGAILHASLVERIDRMKEAIANQFGEGSEEDEEEETIEDFLKRLREEGSKAEVSRQELNRTLQRSLLFEQSFRKFKHWQRSQQIEEECLKRASKKT